MTRGWQLRLAARCETGPVRQYNEDTVAVFTDRGLRCSDPVQADTVATTPGVALVVLDGLGGQSSGAYACQRILAALADQLARPWPADPADRTPWLIAVLRAAHDHLTAQAPQYAGMGATAALVLVVADAAHIVHAGDVRVHRLRDGHLELLTRDDTLINDARDHGMPESDITKISRDIITQALGFGEPTPHARTLALAAGDALLLTSDGLHAFVDPAALETILAADADPPAACAAMIARAIQAGSDDNLTALLARLEPR